MNNWWTKRAEKLLDNELDLYNRILENYKESVLKTQFSIWGFLGISKRLTEAEIKTDLEQIRKSHWKRMDMILKARKIGMLMDKKDRLEFDN